MEIFLCMPLLLVLFSKERQDLQKNLYFTEPKRYNYFTYHEERQKCCQLYL